MIVFLTTAAHRYTIGSLLERAGTPLTGRVLTLSYGEFLSWPRLPVGSYVFADVDRLRPDEAAAVACRIEALQRACPARAGGSITRCTASAGWPCWNACTPPGTTISRPAAPTGRWPGCASRCSSARRSSTGGRSAG